MPAKRRLTQRKINAGNILLERTDGQKEARVALLALGKTASAGTRKMLAAIVVLTIVLKTMATAKLQALAPANARATADPIYVNPRRTSIRANTT